MAERQTTLQPLRWLPAPPALHGLSFCIPRWRNSTQSFRNIVWREGQWSGSAWEMWQHNMCQRPRGLASTQRYKKEQLSVWSEVHHTKRAYTVRTYGPKMGPERTVNDSSYWILGFKWATSGPLSLSCSAGWIGPICCRVLLIKPAPFTPPFAFLVLFLFYLLPFFLSCCKTYIIILGQFSPLINVIIYEFFII